MMIISVTIDRALEVEADPTTETDLMTAVEIVNNETEIMIVSGMIDAIFALEVGAGPMIEIETMDASEMIDAMIDGMAVGREIAEEEATAEIIMVVEATDFRALDFKRFH